jgi:hypothetical protein
MNNLYQKIYFLVLVFFFLIAAGLCDGQTIIADNQKKLLADQSLAIQSKRLDELEKVVSERKKQIEENFAFGEVSIENHVADYMNKFEQSISEPFNRKIATRDLIEAYIDLLPLISYEYSSEAESPAVFEDVSYKFIPSLQKPMCRPYSYLDQIARRFVTDMSRFQEELGQLEKSRGICLAQLAEWEKGRRENIEAIGNTKESGNESDFGVIKAINYEKENSFIMINDKIVYQGQSIGDIEVVRIEPEKVEFKKEGKSWLQKIGEKVTVSI